MARSQAQKNYFTYVKGLVTEASPLTSPENSSSDEDNMDLRRDGTRKRRRGIDYENGGAAASITFAHTAGYFATHTASIHEWRSIGGDGTNNKTIVQIGNTLHIRGLDVAVLGTGGVGITFDNTAIGGGAADTSIDMVNVAVAAADTGLDKVSISFGKGTAFVVAPNINPFIIEYHAATGNYSTHYVGTTAGNLQIRDFMGVDDGLAVDARPPASTWAALVASNPNHAYNLLNQGWTATHVSTYMTGNAPVTTGITSITAGATTSFVTINNAALTVGASITLSGISIPAGSPNINGNHVITGIVLGGLAATTVTISVDTSTATGTYTGGVWSVLVIGGNAPSNSDVWWYGKNSVGVFTPETLDKIWFGSMKGARGHYLYNAFNMARSSYVTGTTNFSTTARPSTTVFYSGRVWYSGIKDNQYSGTILYSRLIEDPIQDAHHCYMDADPTSEVVMDLVASDGGTITIPEAGIITKMVVSSLGLIVFAHNGVWHIQGTADTGFSATGFSVNKVTNVGCTSPDSIVEVEGSIMYWSRSGIYLVQLDNNTLLMAASNITQASIQSRINSVSNGSLPYVKGVYDPLEREVKWAYSEVLDGNNPDYCNKTLTLDLVLEAWYTGTISGDSVANPYIAGVVQSLNSSSVAPDYESMVRFLTFNQVTATSMQVRFSVLYKNSLLDWETSDGIGVEYLSYMETTHELMGDAMRNKSIDDIHLFFKRTEETVTDGVIDQPSSCMLQYKFDWADDVSSGLFTKQEEAYKFVRPLTIPSAVGTYPLNYGQSVIVSKHNVRGSGRAMQLRLESTGTNDMHVLGWATFTSGNTR